MSCNSHSDNVRGSRDVKRSSNIRSSKKIFEFEFVFDPSKFDFQIPAGLNSAKSVLWLH